MKKLNKNPKRKILKRNPDDEFIYNILSPLVNTKRKVILNIDNKFLTMGILEENYPKYEVIENLDFSDEFNLEFDKLPIDFYDEDMAMEILYNQRKINKERIIYSFAKKDVNLAGSGKSIDQTTGLDWAGIYHKARSLHIDTGEAIRRNVFDKLFQDKIIIINLKKDAGVKIEKIRISD